MRFRYSSLLVVVALVALTLPALAHAAGTLPTFPFFGPIIPEGNLQTCAIGWAGVMIVVNRVIVFLLTLAILFVAPLFIAYAGFLLVVNPFNPGAKDQARSILLNTVIGIAVALSAWLIVDAFMAVFYNGKFGSWSEIVTSGSADPCLSVASSLHPVVLPPGGGGGGGTVVGGGGGGGAGSCTVPTSGACASANMGVFGSANQQASQICTAESGADPKAMGDKIDGGPNSGQYVSFGLFQMNISANRVAGLDCPSAFDRPYTGSHKDVVIKNSALYEQCKSAALDANKNIAAAHDLYVGAHDSWRLWSTASKCGLTLGERKALLANACMLTSQYD